MGGTGYRKKVEKPEKYMTGFDADQISHPMVNLRQWVNSKHP